MEKIVKKIYKDNLKDKEYIKKAVETLAGRITDKIYKIKKTKNKDK